MKKIGFIDYFLNEWHANNYPAWIRANAAETGRAYDVAYAWAEIDAYHGISTAEWCAEQKVGRIGTLEELVDKSDCLIVLSPDHPVQHERLASLALMSGKPVYVDKTFAPDLASAKRMIGLAAAYGTPMFTSSALRFSRELAAYPDAKVNRGTIEYVATTGPGTFANYSIHQLEMIVSLMGPGACRIKSLSTAGGRLFVIDYGTGRQASMTQMSAAPFQATIQLKDGEGVFAGPCTHFFPRFIHALLDFFDSSVPPVRPEETLSIMALLEAGGQALAAPDVWIDIGM